MINTNLDKNMAKLLNMPIDVDYIENGEVVKYESKEEILNKSFDDDFTKAKTNLEYLLALGQSALENTISIATQTDDHKSYSTVAGIIKQLADINEQILNLHLTYQKHKGVNANKPEAGTVTNVTNNAIFVGSSAELSKLIKASIGENTNVITAE